MSLLAPDEPSPVVVLRTDAASPFVITCDHAGQLIPRCLGDLGVNAVERARHIGWDIGALGVARVLAARLGAVLIAQRYSRLVIDCNRRLDDPTSIAVESDGQPIPGNVGLTDADRAARARELFGPYHAGIDAELRSAVALCPRDHVPHGPALIAVHSFTDVYGGRERPWHCGILWDRDPRLPLALLEALRDERGLVVGDNEPYSGRHPADFTIDHHAEHRGWPHVCIEVRQDLIAGPAGVEAWARRLATPLADRLSDPNLYRAMQY